MGGARMKHYYNTNQTHFSFTADCRPASRPTYVANYHLRNLVTPLIISYVAMLGGLRVGSEEIENGGVSVLIHYIQSFQH